MKVLAVWLLLSAVAQAGPRVALVIASNVGDRDEQRLHYAEDDARRIAGILEKVGDFAPEDVALLVRPSVSELVFALDALERKLGAAGPDSLLFIFYSGHADAESIHLGGGRFPLADLRTTAARAPASARVLVIDACRSGTVTRVKGGHTTAAFEVQIDAQPGPSGLAVLTSSAAGEAAQESDELRASFFTHYLASAMLGAADRDGDGVITLDETFGYAAGRTVAATATTFAGPQHPTYQYDLSGRESLVLTRPGIGRAGMGQLQFMRTGWYLVRRGPNAVLAEVHGERPGQRLALEAGEYRVTLRERDQYREGQVRVRAGETTPVDGGAWPRQPYVAVARKGGEPVGVALVREPSLQRWKPIYSTGLAVFSASHVTAVMLGLASFFTHGYPTVEGPMSMFPVAGPLAAYGYRAAMGPSYPVGVTPGPYAGGEVHAVGAGYVTTAVLQAVGLGLTLGGDLLRRRSLRERGLSIAPFADGGLLVGGSF